MPQKAYAGIASVFGASIKGDRADQQDSFRSIWLRAERAWLLLIADGMGGHAAGGVASNIAADTFVSSFIGAREAAVSIEDALRSALDAANNKILRQQNASPELRGMGTTLVAAYMTSQCLAWISVGDSPLWACQQGRIVRLNQDHSLRSLVPDHDAAARNMLISALNGAEVPEIDCQMHSNPLRAGDALILSSDGLLTLNESEIETIVGAKRDTDAEQKVNRLLNAVKQRAKSRQDNCSVVIATAMTRDGSATQFRHLKLWLFFGSFVLACALVWLWLLHMGMGW